jgi:hypothetical protein
MISMQRKSWPDDEDVWFTASSQIRVADCVQGRKGHSLINQLVYILHLRVTVTVTMCHWVIAPKAFA